MIVYKTEEEIELIRESSLLVAKAHAEVAKVIGPGKTSLELDKIAEEFIRDNGGVPAFKGYKVGNLVFPGTLCMSPNEEIVHGIPNDKPLEEGDILSVDCGVLMNGFYGDSAYTYAIGEVDDEKKRLLETTKESLYKGLENAIEGKRLGDISAAIQDYCEKAGFSVVREFVGHGVGRDLHEEPQIPNYGRRGNGVKLKKGMVLAIEPMINAGTRSIKWGNDGWTVYTADRKPSAHYEHTIAIGKDKVDILSSFELIEKELKK